jgi:putative two-component system response regulator
MINGQGYPRRHFERGVHAASKLVHVCDVYDALRTRRPYRDAWESERVLTHIEAAMGQDFDREAATAFGAMMRQWERRPATLDGEPASGPSAAPAGAGEAA